MSGKKNRYVLGVAACILITLIYVFISVWMNWRRGGGFIVQIIWFAIMGVAWRAITGTKWFNDEDVPSAHPSDRTADPPKDAAALKPVARAEVPTGRRIRVRAVTVPSDLPTSVSDVALVRALPIDVSRIGYESLAWTIGAEVTPEVARRWTDPSTLELYILRFESGGAAKFQFCKREVCEEILRRLYDAGLMARALAHYQRRAADLVSLAQIFADVGYGPVADIRPEVRRIAPSAWNYCHIMAYIGTATIQIQHLPLADRYGRELLAIVVAKMRQWHAGSVRDLSEFTRAVEDDLKRDASPPMPREKMRSQAVGNWMFFNLYRRPSKSEEELELAGTIGGFAVGPFLGFWDDA